jgi:hypothetical protein
VIAVPWLRRRIAAAPGRLLRILLLRFCAVSTSSSCRCDVALCPLAEIDGAEAESGHSGKADHKV